MILIGYVGKDMWLPEFAHHEYEQLSLECWLLFIDQEKTQSLGSAIHRMNVLA